LEATPRFELGNKGFADLCLTTWLCRHILLVFSKLPTHLRIIVYSSIQMRVRITRAFKLIG
jgi:hypothetical protein